MNKNEGKTTLVIGASENPERYSNMAMRLLKHYGHPVIAIGRRAGSVDGMAIQTLSNCKELSQIDTITLYVNPFHQAEFEDLILGLQPRRVLFNPGTENPDLYEKLNENGIAFEEACTLVLLRSGQF